MPPWEVWLGWAGMGLGRAGAKGLGAWDMGCRAHLQAINIDLASKALTII